MLGQTTGCHRSRCCRLCRKAHAALLGLDWIDACAVGAVWLVCNAWAALLACLATVLGDSQAHCLFEIKKNTTVIAWLAPASTLAALHTRWDGIATQFIWLAAHKGSCGRGNA